jgi:hypothetical protein
MPPWNVFKESINSVNKPQLLKHSVLIEMCFNIRAHIYSLWLPLNTVSRRWMQFCQTLLFNTWAYIVKLLLCSQNYWVFGLYPSSGFQLIRRKRKTRRFGNCTCFRPQVTKSENPVILCVIHHRENPIESTYYCVVPKYTISSYDILSWVFCFVFVMRNKKKKKAQHSLYVQHTSTLSTSDKFSPQRSGRKLRRTEVYYWTL